MTPFPLKLRTCPAPQCTPAIYPRNAYCTRLRQGFRTGSFAAQSLPEEAAGSCSAPTLRMNDGRGRCQFQTDSRTPVAGRFSGTRKS